MPGPKLSAQRTGGDILTHLVEKAVHHTNHILHIHRQGVRQTVRITCGTEVGKISPSMNIPSPPLTDTFQSTRIVGLGASAGGLAALEEFLSHVPAHSGMAFVVVQHRSVNQPDWLVELLRRTTAMPVKALQEAQVAQANTVYVMPPGGELTVHRSCLYFRAVARNPGPRWPINTFLTSLAQDQGARAIGIVLSGMGSDGVLGLQAIRSRGGMTFAQQPDTAEFNSMPQSAIDAGCVDVHAPASELPGHVLSRLATVGADAPTDDPLGDDLLAQVLSLLRAHCKHDMSLYKTSTLQRRIERRMAVHQLDTMSDYISHLQGNPQELDLLFAEMLIGVTTFFRDSAVWTDLKEQVLPGMLVRSEREGPFRAWVVGCSTGEEAYSLAMLFQEWLDMQPEPPPEAFQVFASDLNADAIAVARKGWYSAHALANVSAQRRERFFVSHEGGYQISPVIRDRVLFARHDVIIDPPFTRLDLLSCRNVLIYFNAALQRRLIPLFHYSLRQGGVLVLGGAETVGRSQTLFTTISPKSRIYRRNELPLQPGSVEFPIHRFTKSRTAVQEMSVSATPVNNLQSLADQALLQNFAPPAVLVNEAGDILYINGRTGRYLEPAAGKANWNIHVMARPGIRSQLAVALRQVFKDRVPVDVAGLAMEADVQRSLMLSVHPMGVQSAQGPMALVVFRETELAIAPASSGDVSYTDKDVVLTRQLQAARDEIQALRHEMQTSRADLQAANESLQSANEELQSTNEELQSTNEELTTSKEEAQSMNEELQTINGELQSKLDDLSLAQSDMQNLLNSTDIATLFLDNDLNVRRYTEQATSIFHLRESDVGRPLSDLASILNYPHLKTDVKETLRTLTACTQSVEATDGRWFSVRIMPYRTLSNMIQGAVLTFVDVTVSKTLEMRLRKSQDATESRSGM